MIDRSLVYASQDYRGEATPAAGTLSLDRSREKNNGTETSVGYTKLPSGLWVHTQNAETDKVALGTAESLNFTSQNFSGVLWIYLTDLATNHYILNKGTIANNGWNFAVESTGRLSFSTSDGTLDQTRSAVSQFSINTWYFVAFYRSSITAKVFSQAVDITSLSGTHNNPVSISDTCYLASYRGASQGIRGMYALARIWVRALSAGEIANIYNSERSLFGL